MPDLSQCEDIIKSEDVKAIYEKMRHELVDKVEVQELCTSIDKKEVNLIKESLVEELKRLKIYENNK